jgi:hypothetical protein
MQEHAELKNSLASNRRGQNQRRAIALTHALSPNNSNTIKRPTKCTCHASSMLACEIRRSRQG